MAVVYVDEEQPLCISGDSGGGIFVWSTSFPLGQEPIKKWNEPKDWRYSGIHSLAISGKYLYTGSGDKTIKAWSLLVMNIFSSHDLFQLQLHLFQMLYIIHNVLSFTGWCPIMHYEWP